MQRLQRKTDGFVPDHAAFLHQRLAGDQAALAVFIVDQRQPALIGRNRLVAAAGEIRIGDLADAVGITAAGHRAGRAGVEIGQQRDRLLAVPRTFDRLAAERNQLAQFGGGLRRLDLEIGDVLSSRAMRARKAADSGVPATGASWIMIGIEIASDTVRKNSKMAFSPTRMVAP